MEGTRTGVLWQSSASHPLIIQTESQPPAQNGRAILCWFNSSLENRQGMHQFVLFVFRDVTVPNVLIPTRPPANRISHLSRQRRQSELHHHRGYFSSVHSHRVCRNIAIPQVIGTKSTQL
jgi:hypothetical protein